VATTPNEAGHDIFSDLRLLHRCKTITGVGKDFRVGVFLCDINIFHVQIAQSYSGKLKVSQKLSRTNSKLI